MLQELKGRYRSFWKYQEEQDYDANGEKNKIDEIHFPKDVRLV